MFRRVRSLKNAVTERLQGLVGQKPPSEPARVAPKRREPPPVFLFIDGARGREAVADIERICSVYDVTPARRDVGDDEAMREFVLREARIDRDDLPVLFVANRLLGGVEGLTAREKAGTLQDDLRTA